MPQYLSSFALTTFATALALFGCEDSVAPSPGPTSPSLGTSLVESPSASADDSHAAPTTREPITDSMNSSTSAGPGNASTEGSTLPPLLTSTTAGHSSGSETADGEAASSGGETAAGTEQPSTSNGIDAAAPEGPLGPSDLPDPGTEGDGRFELGPSYSAQRELSDLGAPKGRRFEFKMRLADSRIFNGKDATLDPNKNVNSERSIVVYVPARYVDGTPAPLLVIQDGPGDIGLVQNALDNLTTSDDEQRRLPAFVAIAVQNGGNDAQGSERGLEYDTMSDRYARFIEEEVLPAVVADPGVAAAYPHLRFTTEASGRASLGCSSGGAAALTMGWFRPDLFSRIITYSGTFVDQQDHDAPEVALYPDGAWGYHSNQRLIQTTEKKPLRIFLNVNENDLRADDPESTLHNWVMANERTAEALAEKGYHYRYVFGRGVGHCDGSIRRATLADALIWVWRGYESP